MKTLREILAWLKRSFEEKDGKTSAKRKTAFAFVLLISYVVVRYSNNENAVIMVEVLLGGTLLSLGITAYQNVKTNKDGSGEGE